MLTYFIYLLAATCQCVVLGVEPRFNVVTKNVTVVSGQTAVLPCSVEFLGDYKASKKQPAVVWLDHRDKILTFEDRRIISDERISLERPYVKEWNLHIRNVKSSDEGVYMCQINTDPVQIRPIRLNVHVPARIDRLLSSSDLTAKEGDTVTLVCNVTGVPQPTVTWYRMLSGSSKEKERIGAEGEVMLIHNVTRYCDDIYQCVAFNGVQPADFKTMRVHVHFAPEIRLPNKKIGQSRGKETILECIVQAYPIGVTLWKHKGKVLEQNWKYRLEVYEDDPITFTLSLRIRSIDEEDYGVYTCIAENSLGTDFEKMHLYEYPKYEPVTSTTTPRITTSWFEETNHGNHRPDKGPGEGDRKFPTYYPRTVPPRGDIPPYETENNRNLEKDNRPEHGNQPDSSGHVFANSGHRVKISFQTVEMTVGVCLVLLCVLVIR